MSKKEPTLGTGPGGAQETEYERAIRLMRADKWPYTEWPEGTEPQRAAPPADAKKGGSE